MFSKIFNPKTKRFVNVKGKAGRTVINNYQNHIKIMGGGGKTTKKNHYKKHSKKNNKESPITKKRHIRIFHATWCDYCIKSMPIFIKLKNTNHPLIKFTIHDIDELGDNKEKIYEALMSKLSVNSYPTIVEDSGNTFDKDSHLFNGNRTYDGILSWAKMTPKERVNQSMIINL